MQSPAPAHRGLYIVNNPVALASAVYPAAMARWLLCYCLYGTGTNVLKACISAYAYVCQIWCMNEEVLRGGGDAAWWRVAYAPRGSCEARGRGQRGRIPAVTSRPPRAPDIHLVRSPYRTRTVLRLSTVSAIIVVTTYLFTVGSPTTQFL